MWCRRNNTKVFFVSGSTIFEQGPAVARVGYERIFQLDDEHFFRFLCLEWISD
jgi:hypothetical protein